MPAESELREQLSACTRILAMQGLIGLFGHVSVYQPETKRIFITPGSGSDKSNFRAEDMLAIHLDGRPLEERKLPPIEWPIHTALHANRADALAVAHLHSPYATLFAIAKREFHPVTLQGTIFGGGVPLYDEAHLVTTPERGSSRLKAMGSNRAVLMRGHGIVVVGKNLAEVLYASLILEDDAKKTLQAASLGPVGHLTPEECRGFDAEIDFDRRSKRAWDYFWRLEACWDRQSATGKIELFP
jgi:ribulose-5-phosphate 4-epimerase/fuculose-1-phosphate aldolase